MYKLRQQLAVKDEIARLKYHMALQENRPCEFNLIRSGRIIAKVLTDNVNILTDLLQSGYSLDTTGG